jgi:hypothetical protein
MEDATPAAAGEQPAHQAAKLLDNQHHLLVRHG